MHSSLQKCELQLAHSRQPLLSVGRRRWSAGEREKGRAPAIARGSDECRRSALFDGTPRVGRGPTLHQKFRGLKAPLAIHDIHVARLTRHDVWRALGNSHTGNRWNTGSASGNVKVDLSASGNRELDDRTRIGNRPVLHRPIPRPPAESGRVDDAPVDRRREDVAARVHRQGDRAGGRVDAERDAPYSARHCVMN